MSDDDSPFVPDDVAKQFDEEIGSVQEAEENVPMFPKPKPADQPVAQPAANVAPVAPPATPQSPVVDSQATQPISPLSPPSPVSPEVVVVPPPQASPAPKAEAAGARAPRSKLVVSPVLQSQQPQQRSIPVIDLPEVFEELPEDPAGLGLPRGRRGKTRAELAAARKQTEAEAEAERARAQREMDELMWEGENDQFGSQAQSDTQEAVARQAAGDVEDDEDVFVPDDYQDTAEQPSPRPSPSEEPAQQPPDDDFGEESVVRRLPFAADEQQQQASLSSAQLTKHWPDLHDPYRAPLSRSLDSVLEGVKKAIDKTESKRSTAANKVPSPERAKQLQAEADKAEAAAQARIARNMQREVKASMATEEAHAEWDVAGAAAAASPPSSFDEFTPEPAIAASQPPPGLNASISAPAAAAGVGIVIAPQQPSTPASPVAAQISPRSQPSPQQQQMPAKRRRTGVMSAAFVAQQLETATRAATAAKKKAEEEAARAGTEFKLDFDAARQSAYSGIRRSKAAAAAAAPLPGDDDGGLQDMGLGGLEDSPWHADSPPRMEAGLEVLVDLLKLRTRNRAVDIATLRSVQDKRLEANPFMDIMVHQGDLVQDIDALDDELLEIVMSVPELDVITVPKVEPTMARAAIVLLDFAVASKRVPSVESLADAISAVWRKHASLSHRAPADLNSKSPLEQLVLAIERAQAGVLRHNIVTTDYVVRQDLKNATLARELRNLDEKDAPSGIGLSLMGNREAIVALHTTAKACSQRIIEDGICDYIEFLRSAATSHTELDDAIDVIGDLLASVFQDVYAQWVHTAHCHGTQEGLPQGDIEGVQLRVKKLRDDLIAYQGLPGRQPIVDEVNLAAIDTFLVDVQEYQRPTEAYKAALAARFAERKAPVDLLTSDMHGAPHDTLHFTAATPIERQTIQHWVTVIDSYRHLKVERIRHCVLMASHINRLASDLWQLSVYNADVSMLEAIRKQLHLLRICLAKFILPAWYQYYHAFPEEHKHKLLWAYEFHMILADQLLYATEFGLRSHNMRDDEARTLWNALVLFQEHIAFDKLLERTRADFDDVLIHSVHICNGFIVGGAAGFVYDALLVPEQAFRMYIHDNPDVQQERMGRIWNRACLHVNIIVQLLEERYHCHKKLKRPNWLLWASESRDEKKYLEAMRGIDRVDRCQFVVQANASVSVFMNLLFALHTEHRFAPTGRLPVGGVDVDSPVDRWREEDGGFNLLTFEQAVGTMRDWNVEEFDQDTTDDIDRIDREREKLAQEMAAAGRGPFSFPRRDAPGPPVSPASPEQKEPEPSPARPRRRRGDQTQSVEMSLVDMLDNTSYCVSRIHAWYGNMLRRKWTYKRAKKTKRGAAGVEQAGETELTAKESQFLDLPRPVKARSTKFVGGKSAVTDADMMLLLLTAAHSLLLQPRQQVAVSAFQWPEPGNDVKWVPVVESKNPSSIEIRLQQMISGSSAARATAVKENKNVPRLTRALHVAGHLLNVEHTLPDQLIQPDATELQNLELSDIMRPPAIAADASYALRQSEWEGELRPLLQRYCVTTASSELLVGPNSMSDEALTEARHSALLMVQRLLRNTQWIWNWLAKVDLIMSISERWKVDLLIDCVCWTTQFGSLSKKAEETLYNYLSKETVLRDVLANALDALAAAAHKISSGPSWTFADMSILCTRIACTLLLGRRHFVFATKDGIEKADAFVHLVMHELALSASEADAHDSVDVPRRDAAPFTRSCFNAMTEGVSDEEVVMTDRGLQRTSTPQKAHAATHPGVGVESKTPVKRRTPKKQHIPVSEGKRSTRGTALRTPVSRRHQPGRRAKEKQLPQQPDMDWEPVLIENETKTTPPKFRTPEAQREVNDLKAKDRHRGIQAADIDELNSEARAYSWTALFFALLVNGTAGDGFMVWEENKLIVNPDGGTTITTHVRKSVFDPSIPAPVREAEEKKEEEEKKKAEAAPERSKHRDNPKHKAYVLQLMKFEQEARDEFKHPHVFVALSNKIAYDTKWAPREPPRCYMLGLFSGRHFKPGDVITKYGGILRDTFECHQLDASQKSHIQALPDNCPQCLDGKDYADSYDLSVLEDDAGQYNMQFMKPSEERIQFVPTKTPAYLSAFKQREFITNAAFGGQGYMINTANLTEVNCKAVMVYPSLRSADYPDNYPTCFIVATKAIKPFQELYRAYGSSVAAELLATENQVRKAQQEQIEDFLDERSAGGSERKTVQDEAREQIADDAAATAAAEAVAAGGSESEAQGRLRQQPRRAAADRSRASSSELARKMQLTGIDEKNKFRMDMFRRIVELRPSEAHGGRGSLGLFAKQALPAFTELCYFDGRRLHPKELSTLTEKQYNLVMLFATKGSVAPGCQWILPRFPLNVAGWFNHPSALETANCQVGQQDHKVITLRDIRMDEELLIDYDLAYWARAIFKIDNYEALEPDEQARIAAKIKVHFKQVEQTETKTDNLAWTDAWSPESIQSRRPPEASKVDKILAASRRELGPQGDQGVDAAPLPHAPGPEAAAGRQQPAPAMRMANAAPRPGGGGGDGKQVRFTQSTKK